VTKEEIKAATLRSQPTLKQLIQSRVTGINPQQLEQLFQSPQYGQLVDLFSQQMAAIINGCIIFVGGKQTSQQQAAQLMSQAVQQILQACQRETDLANKAKIAFQTAQIQAKQQEISQQQKEISDTKQSATSSWGDVWNVLVGQVVNEVKTRGLINPEAQKILQTITSGGGAAPSNITSQQQQMLQTAMQSLSQAKNAWQQALKIISDYYSNQTQATQKLTRG
jgi:hypothetical protein